MAENLDAFFSAMEKFLSQDMSAGEVEKSLGACPSGTERLQVYQHLVKHDVARILDDGFKALAGAMNRVRAGWWSETLSSYWSKHPAMHWEPMRYGEHLAEFLEAQREIDPSQPQYFEELADFHLTRYQAAIARVSEEGDVMDRSVFIRQYTHTVPQFVRAFDASPDAPLPEAKPTIVIIFQSLQTLGPKVMYPSLPTLLALARRTNTAAALREQFSQIDDALIAEGDAKLVSAGVLP
jgi:hypothetical protein